ncbi:MAG: polysaccharide deacetylase family protein [Actinomycetota bacterium]|nr:polysaccharide deacetylase family protein [Actinomycetota bacterium]
MALTIDDGPDPEWTPKVLDLLAEHGIRASFFLVRQNALTHSDLVNAEVRAGHVIGS